MKGYSVVAMINNWFDSACKCPQLHLSEEGAFYPHCNLSPKTHLITIIDEKKNQIKFKIAQVSGVIDTRESLKN